jgi:hypothetical protein
MMNKMVAFFARKAPQIFRRSRYSGVKVVERVSDVPASTGPSIFVVERAGHHQWAVFDCPCRTGHRLTVSLRKDDHPHWTAEWRGKKVSFHPSLWLSGACRSHFWIRDNKVMWVPM